jgi:hypothetical protein
MKNLGKFYDMVDSISDLETMNKLLSYTQTRWRQMSSVRTRGIRLGDDVTFNDKYGIKRVGRVTKINPKTIFVQVGATRWRVSHGLVKLEEKVAA